MDTSIYEQIVSIVGEMPETFDLAYVVSCAILVMFIYVLLKILMSIFNW